LIPLPSPSSDATAVTSSEGGPVLRSLRRVSVAGAAGLSVALAAYVALLRPPTSYDMLAMMAIGAALLASVLILWRSFLPETPTPSPMPTLLPLTPPDPAPHPHAESAFVCAKCGEYSPAPDWEGMLRAIDGPKDLEGHGEEKPTITPTAAPVDPIWPRWQPAVASAGPAERPAALATTAYVPHAWSAAAPGREVEPEEFRSEAEFGAVPDGVGGIALTGGTWIGSDGPAALPHPLLGPETGPGPLLDEVSRSGGYRVAPVPAAGTLERWIADEANGLVTGALPADGVVARPTLAAPVPESGGPPAIEVPSFHPCATCASPVERSRETSTCSECHRPICVNCRGSSVRHEDRTYCSPCAAQRAGPDLLRTLEDPIPIPTDIDPLDEDLGVRPARAGGRRSAGRARGSASHSAHPAPGTRRAAGRGAR